MSDPADKEGSKGIRLEKAEIPWSKRKTIPSLLVTFVFSVIGMWGFVNASDHPVITFFDTLSLLGVVISCDCLDNLTQSPLSRRVVYILGCGLWVWLFLWILCVSRIIPQPVFFLPLIPFLLCTLDTVRIFFSKQAGLVIDSKGITCHNGFVATENIVEIVRVTRRAGKNNFFMVMLKNPEEYMKTLNLFRRIEARVNFRIYGSPISLSTNFLKCSDSELEKLLGMDEEKASIFDLMREKGFKNVNSDEVEIFCAGHTITWLFLAFLIFFLGVVFFLGGVVFLLEQPVSGYSIFVLFDGLMLIGIASFMGYVAFINRSGFVINSRGITYRDNIISWGNVKGILPLRVFGLTILFRVLLKNPGQYIGKASTSSVILFPLLHCNDAEFESLIMHSFARYKNNNISDRVEIRYTSWAMLCLFAFLSISFIGFSFLPLTPPYSIDIGFAIFLSAFFMNILFYVIYTLFRKKLVIDRTGLSCIDGGDERENSSIRWESITEIILVTEKGITGKSNLFVIGLKNPEEYIKTLDRHDKNFAESNFWKYGSPAVISVKSLQCNVFILKRLLDESFNYYKNCNKGDGKDMPCLTQ